MRKCSYCGIDCDSSLGLSRELTTVYWGGKRNGNVEKSPRLVSFFCSEQHRNDFLVEATPGGEIQSNKISVSDLDSDNFQF